MKKSNIILLILIIATILLTFSCNSDATEGIFKYISETNENLNMRINSYLGKSGSVYYYIEDSDLKSYNGTSISIIAESSPLAINRLGYFDVTNDKVYLLNSNGTIKWYDITAPTPTPEVFDDTKTYTILTTNGYSQEGTNIYKIPEKTTPLFTTTGRIDSILPSGNDVLINFVEADVNKVCLIQNGTEKGTLTMQALGFQKISATKYLIIDKDKNLYEWNGTDANATDTTKDITEATDDSIIKSFVSDDVAYFHLKPYFVKVDTTSDNNTEEITDGFASNLRNEDIVNFIDNIAATVSNGLFAIDITQNTSTNIFKIND